jgi:hypothetical protein
MTDNKQAYVDKVDAQMREWRAQIEELNARADKASAEKKIEYNKKIDNLLVQLREMESRTQMLREAQSDAWEKVKDGVDSAWKDLKKGISDAVSTLK